MGSPDKENFLVPHGKFANAPADFDEPAEEGGKSPNTTIRTEGIIGLVHRFPECFGSGLLPELLQTGQKARDTKRGTAGQGRKSPSGMVERFRIAKPGNAFKNETASPVAKTEQETIRTQK